MGVSAFVLRERGFSGWYVCKEAGGVHVEAGTELREKKTTTPARDLLWGGKGRWGAPPSPVIIIMILWYTYLEIPRSLCTRTQGYEIGNNACMWLTLSSVELLGRRYMGSTTTCIWLECGKDRGQTTSRAHGNEVTNKLSLLKKGLGHNSSNRMLF